MNHDDPNEGTGTPGWIVPVLLIVCLVVIVSVMSGCAPDTGAKPTPRANTAPVSPTSATTADTAFLASLHASSSDWGGRTDADLEAIGHRTCTWLQDGYSATATATGYVLNDGLAPADAGYLVGAAIGAYCPNDHTKDAL